MAGEGGGRDGCPRHPYNERAARVSADAGPSVPLGAIFFAVGSLIFSYLLLRGRMVPVSIAWLGVFASGLLVVALPLQLAGFSTGPLTGYYQWLPALVFQIVLALWLLIKGVADTGDAMSATSQDV